MVRASRKTLMVESLEARCVPATRVGVDKGALTIIGDDNSNAVTVERQSRQDPRLVVVVADAGVKPIRHVLNTALVWQISFFGHGGNDGFDLKGVSVPGNVILSGGEGNNGMRLWGPLITGFVSYTGGSKNDTLTIDGEVDGVVRFEGGDGTNYLDYNRATILGPTFFFGGVNKDTLNVSRQAVVMGPVSAKGFDGNDSLMGGRGVDHLDGGDNNDHLAGGGGNDYLYGGVGADWLYGEAGDDELFGGADYDRLYGGPDDDYLDGGQDGIADRLVGEGGNDTFEGEWYYVPISVRPYWGWLNYDKALDARYGETVTNRGR